MIGSQPAQHPVAPGRALKNRRESSFLPWIAPILLLGFAVRVIGLGASDLWLDEAVSAYISRKPTLDILAYSATHIREHPPGYYLLLHGWIGLAGDGEFALRLLSAFGGVLAIALAAALANRWFGRAAGVLAGLLMAVNPMAVQYATDARMYSWVMALTLLAVLLWDRAMVLDRLRNWASFAAVMACMIAFHYMAGLTLAAFAIFAVVRWRRLPPARTHFAAVLAVLLGAGLLGLLLPGPRTSLAQIVQERLAMPVQLRALESFYTRWALGPGAEDALPARAWLLATAWWALAAIGIAAMPAPRRGKRADLQWLLALLILVPAVLASLAFAYIEARHYSSTLGLFVIAAALGILAIWRWKPALGAVAAGAPLLIGLVLIAGQLDTEWRPFSPAMAHIIERAQDDEQLVYTYFLDWPLDEYYNRRGIARRSIPESPLPITDAEIESKVQEALAAGAGVWLHLYPGPEATERVQSAFDRAGYPAEKQWFTGGRGVVHYFAPQPMTDQAGTAEWAEGIRLNRWRMSAPTVEAGDALRIEFEWQRTKEIGGPAAAALTLVGPDGQVWASRLGAPCNDDCPTTDWGDLPITDRVAFQVPADTPPGEYQLRLGWINYEGAPLLGQGLGASQAQVDLPLADVRVAPDAIGAGRPVAAPVGKVYDAPLGSSLKLVSTAVDGRTVTPGETLAAPLQIEVLDPPGQLDLHLLLEKDGLSHRITAPAGPAWHPSAEWTPGSLVRVQPQFPIPGSLAPGAYTAAIAVSPAGTTELTGQAAVGGLMVKDRERIFDLPEAGAPVDAAWQEGIRLAKVDAPAEATAGTPTDVTLVWQAGGPATRNWKVYLHLLDAEGTIRAQSDGYPANGKAPAASWQAGEVTTDERTLSLPADLPADDYILRVGFYDAVTGERLPMTDGADGFTLPAPLVVREPRAAK
jgi:4-amino-4-deoxy-L-arabinose transferase-like glycosyltransferase